MASDRMKRLIEAIRMLMEENFSGYIKINFSQGSLGRIEKSEEIMDSLLLNYGKEASMTGEDEEKCKFQY
jgi:hypothetical protein